uniref:EGF-like domain-containing protein n=1 Tax=Panagrellus redivivus TaxID=6233 RepID=A0A7E4W0Z1_PANRE
MTFYASRGMSVNRRRVNCGTFKETAFFVRHLTVPTSRDCSQDASICHRHGFCISDLKMCICETGYAGDGLNCTDVNECEANDNPCKGQDGDKCVNIEGGYVCCDPLLSDDQCIAEKGAYCSGGCGPYAFCFNQTCTCMDGFQGNPKVLCEDINECENEELCPGSAEWCVNRIGSYLCCNANSTEPECQGLSVSDGNKLFYSESDAITFKGKKFTAIIEKGESQRNESGGAFILARGNESDYSSEELLVDSNGIVFSLELPACDENSPNNATDCPNNSECTQGRCHCFSGYEYRASTGTCIDIDECAQDPRPCSEVKGQWCVNTNGGYLCCDRFSTPSECLGLEIVPLNSKSGEGGLRSASSDELTLHTGSKSGKWITESFGEFRNTSGGEVIITRGKIAPEGIEFEAEGGSTTAEPESGLEIVGSEINAFETVPDDGDESGGEHESEELVHEDKDISSRERDSHSREQKIPTTTTVNPDFDLSSTTVLSGESSTISTSKVDGHSFPVGSNGISKSGGFETVSGSSGTSENGTSAAIIKGTGFVDGSAAPDVQLPVSGESTTAPDGKNTMKVDGKVFTFTDAPTTPVDSGEAVTDSDDAEKLSTSEPEVTTSGGTTDDTELTTNEVTETSTAKSGPESTTEDTVMVDEKAFKFTDVGKSSTVSGVSETELPHKSTDKPGADKTEGGKVSTASATSTATPKSKGDAHSTSVAPKATTESKEATSEEHPEAESPDVPEIDLYSGETAEVKADKPAAKQSKTTKKPVTSTTVPTKTDSTAEEVQGKPDPKVDGAGSSNVAPNSTKLPAVPSDKSEPPKSSSGKATTPAGKVPSGADVTEIPVSPKEPQSPTNPPASNKKSNGTATSPGMSPLDGNDNASSITSTKPKTESDSEESATNPVAVTTAESNEKSAEKEEELSTTNVPATVEEPAKTKSKTSKAPSGSAANSTGTEGFEVGITMPFRSTTTPDPLASKPTVKHLPSTTRQPVSMPNIRVTTGLEIIPDSETSEEFSLVAEIKMQSTTNGPKSVDENEPDDSEETFDLVAGVTMVNSLPTKTGDDQNLTDHTTLAPSPAQSGSTTEKPKMQIEMKFVDRHTTTTTTTTTPRSVTATSNVTDITEDVSTAQPDGKSDHSTTVSEVDASKTSTSTSSLLTELSTEPSGLAATTESMLTSQTVTEATSEESSFFTTVANTIKSTFASIAGSTPDEEQAKNATASVSQTTAALSELSSTLSTLAVNESESVPKLTTVATSGSPSDQSTASGNLELSTAAPSGNVSELESAGTTEGLLLGNTNQTEPEDSTSTPQVGDKATTVVIDVDGTTTTVESAASKSTTTKASGGKTSKPSLSKSTTVSVEDLTSPTPVDLDEQASTSANNFKGNTKAESSTSVEPQISDKATTEVAETEGTTVSAVSAASQSTTTAASAGRTSEPSGSVGSTTETEDSASTLPVHLDKQSSTTAASQDKVTVTESPLDKTETASPDTVSATSPITPDTTDSSTFEAKESTPVTPFEKAATDQPAKTTGEDRDLLAESPQSTVSLPTEPSVTLGTTAESSKNKETVVSTTSESSVTESTASQTTGVSGNPHDKSNEKFVTPTTAEVGKAKPNALTTTSTSDLETSASTTKQPDVESESAIPDSATSNTTIDVAEKPEGSATTDSPKASESTVAVDVSTITADLNNSGATPIGDVENTTSTEAPEATTPPSLIQSVMNKIKETFAGPTEENESVEGTNETLTTVGVSNVTPASTDNPVDKKLESITLSAYTGTTESPKLETANHVTTNVPEDKSRSSSPLSSSTSQVNAQPSTTLSPDSSELNGLEISAADLNGPSGNTTDASNNATVTSISVSETTLSVHGESTPLVDNSSKQTTESPTAETTKSQGESAVSTVTEDGSDKPDVSSTALPIDKTTLASGTTVETATLSATEAVDNVSPDGTETSSGTSKKPLKAGGNATEAIETSFPNGTEIASTTPLPDESSGTTAEKKAVSTTNTSDGDKKSTSAAPTTISNLSSNQESTLLTTAATEVSETSANPLDQNSSVPPTGLPEGPVDSTTTPAERSSETSAPGKVDANASKSTTVGSETAATAVTEAIPSASSNATESAIVPTTTLPINVDSETHTAVTDASETKVKTTFTAETEVTTTGSHLDGHEGTSLLTTAKTGVSETTVNPEDGLLPTTVASSNSAASKTDSTVSTLTTVQPESSETTGSPSGKDSSVQPTTVADESTSENATEGTPVSVNPGKSAVSAPVGSTTVAPETGPTVVTESTPAASPTNAPIVDEATKSSPDNGISETNNTVPDSDESEEFELSGNVKFETTTSPSENAALTSTVPSDVKSGNTDTTKPPISSALPVSAVSENSSTPVSGATTDEPSGVTAAGTTATDVTSLSPEVTDSAVKEEKLTTQASVIDNADTTTVLSSTVAGKSITEKPSTETGELGLNTTEGQVTSATPVVIATTDVSASTISQTKLASHEAVAGNEKPETDATPVDSASTVSSVTPDESDTATATNEAGSKSTVGTAESTSAPTVTPANLPEELNKTNTTDSNEHAKTTVETFTPSLSSTSQSQHTGGSETQTTKPAEVPVTLSSVRPGDSDLTTVTDLSNVTTDASVTVTILPALTTTPSSNDTVTNGLEIRPDNAESAESVPKFTSSTSAPDSTKTQKPLTETSSSAPLVEEVKSSPAIGGSVATTASHVSSEDVSSTTEPASETTANIEGSTVSAEGNNTDSPNLSVSTDKPGTTVVSNEVTTAETLQSSTIAGVVKSLTEATSKPTSEQPEITLKSSVLPDVATTAFAATTVSLETASNASPKPSVQSTSQTIDVQLGSSTTAPETVTVGKKPSTTPSSVSTFGVTDASTVVVDTTGTPVDVESAVKPLEQPSTTSTSSPDNTGLEISAKNVEKEPAANMTSSSAASASVTETTTKGVEPETVKSSTPFVVNVTADNLSTVSTATVKTETAGSTLQPQFTVLPEDETTDKTLPQATKVVTSAEPDDSDLLQPFSTASTDAPKTGFEASTSSSSTLTTTASESLKNATDTKSSATPAEEVESEEKSSTPSVSTQSIDSETETTTSLKPTEHASVQTGSTDKDLPNASSTAMPSTESTLVSSTVSTNETDGLEIVPNGELAKRPELEADLASSENTGTTGRSVPTSESTTVLNNASSSSEIGVTTTSETTTLPNLSNTTTPSEGNIPSSETESSFSAETTTIPDLKSGLLPEDLSESAETTATIEKTSTIGTTLHESDSAETTALGTISNSTPSNGEESSSTSSPGDNDGLEIRPDAKESAENITETASTPLTVKVTDVGSTTTESAELNATEASLATTTNADQLSSATVTSSLTGGSKQPEDVDEVEGKTTTPLSTSELPSLTTATDSINTQSIQTTGTPSDGVTEQTATTSASEASTGKVESTDGTTNGSNNVSTVTSATVTLAKGDEVATEQPSTLPDSAISSSGTTAESPSSNEVVTDETVTESTLVSVMTTVSTEITDSTNLPKNDTDGEKAVETVGETTSAAPSTTASDGVTKAGSTHVELSTTPASEVTAESTTVKPDATTAEIEITSQPAGSITVDSKARASTTTESVLTNTGSTVQTSTSESASPTDGLEIRLEGNESTSSPTTDKNVAITEEEVSTTTEADLEKAESTSSKSTTSKFPEPSTFSTESNEGLEIRGESIGETPTPSGASSTSVATSTVSTGLESPSAIDNATQTTSDVETATLTSSVTLESETNPTTSPSDASSLPQSHELRHSAEIRKGSAELESQEVDTTVGSTSTTVRNTEIDTSDESTESENVTRTAAIGKSTTPVFSSSSVSSSPSVPLSTTESLSESSVRTALTTEAQAPGESTTSSSSLGESETAQTTVATTDTSVSGGFPTIKTTHKLIEEPWGKTTTTERAKVTGVESSTTASETASTLASSTTDLHFEAFSTTPQPSQLSTDATEWLLSTKSGEMLGSGEAGLEISVVPDGGSTESSTSAERHLGSTEVGLEISGIDVITTKAPKTAAANLTLATEVTGSSTSEATTANPDTIIETDGNENLTFEEIERIKAGKAPGAPVTAVTETGGPTSTLLPSSTATAVPATTEDLSRPKSGEQGLELSGAGFGENSAEKSTTPAESTETNSSPAATTESTTAPGATTPEGEGDTNTSPAAVSETTPVSAATTPEDKDNANASPTTVSETPAVPTSTTPEGGDNTSSSPSAVSQTTKIPSSTLPGSTNGEATSVSTASSTPASLTTPAEDLSQPKSGEQGLELSGTDLGGKSTESTTTTDGESSTTQVVSTPSTTENPGTPKSGEQGLELSGGDLGGKSTETTTVESEANSTPSQGTSSPEANSTPSQGTSSPSTTENPGTPKPGEQGLELTGNGFGGRSTEQTTTAVESESSTVTPESSTEATSTTEQLGLELSGHGVPGEPKTNETGLEIGPTESGSAESTTSASTTESSTPETTTTEASSSASTIESSSASTTDSAETTPEVDTTSESTSTLASSTAESTVSETTESTTDSSESISSTLSSTTEAIDATEESTTSSSSTSGSTFSESNATFETDSTTPESTTSSTTEAESSTVSTSESTLSTSTESGESTPSSTEVTESTTDAATSATESTAEFTESSTAEQSTTTVEDVTTVSSTSETSTVSLTSEATTGSSTESSTSPTTEAATTTQTDSTSAPTEPSTLSTAFPVSASTTEASSTPSSAATSTVAEPSSSSPSTPVSSTSAPATSPSTTEAPVQTSVAPSVIIDESEKEESETDFEELTTTTLQETLAPLTATLPSTNVSKCLSSNECGIDADCERRSGACRCKPGFRGNPPSEPCKDVDECKEETNDCNASSRCLNYVGGYQCVCAIGYRKNAEHGCVDIDECKESNGTLCDPNAVCRNLPGAYLCECNAGYTGDGYACINIEKRHCTHEEWARSDCGRNHHCLVDGHGVVDCDTCKAGFTKKHGICSDINECEEHAQACHTDAVCRNTMGGYLCQCQPGYAGDGHNCIDIDECAGNNGCHPQASCVNTLGSYTCQCPEGWTGDGFTACLNPVDQTCAQRSDFCQTKGGNNSACLSVSVGNALQSVCECLPNYRLNAVSGECEDIDECLENRDNCDTATTTCVNTPGSFLCNCASGYEGLNGVCVDIDECQRGTAGCHVNAHCINRIGSVECRCAAGFTGDGTDCIAVDGRHATAGNNCNEDWVHMCRSLNKTCHIDDEEVPQCGSCLFGFQPMDGKCLPINAVGNCADPNKNDCDVNAECIDVRPGRHFCSCKVGYIGDGMHCDDVDECSIPRLCDVHANCQNTNGSYECHCKEGFAGNGFKCVLATHSQNCRINPQICHENAGCQPDGTCKCLRNFEGDGVSSCDAVSESNTTKHALETTTAGRSTYSTESPFLTTTTDSTRCSEHDRTACHVLATCDVDAGECVCRQGFMGDGYIACTRMWEDCTVDETMCHANATCDRASRQCICNLGHIGDGISCVPDKMDCVVRENLCSDLAQCVARRCVCGPGYTGDGSICMPLEPPSEAFGNCSACHSHATCVNSNVCSCNQGCFGNGVMCVPDPQDCVNYPGVCHMNGFCDTAARRCSCKKGFLGNGLDCSRRISCTADASICHAEAKCLSDGRCECNEGLLGDGVECHKAITASEIFGTSAPQLVHFECESDCGINAECVNGACKCQTGFLANHDARCDDIDECKMKTANCHANAKCFNTEGSYECRCNDGFLGDGRDCYQPQQNAPVGTDGLELECRDDGVNLLLTEEVQPFTGRVFVRGQSENPHCTKTFSAATANETILSFFIPLAHCDMALEANETLAVTVVIQKHSTFITEKAYAYRLRCTYPTATRMIMAHYNVSDITTAETIREQGSAPQCQLTVTNEEDITVDNAIVGQLLKLTLFIVPNDTFTVVPRNCYAINLETSERYALTDEAGCAVDEQLFPEWTRVRPALTTAAFSTFKWPDSSMIRFECDCAACLDECPQINCERRRQAIQRRTKMRFARDHDSVFFDATEIDAELERELQLIKNLKLAESPTAFSTVVAVADNVEERMAQKQMEQWLAKGNANEETSFFTNLDEERVCIGTPWAAICLLSVLFSLSLLVTMTRIYHKRVKATAIPDATTLAADANSDASSAYIKF